MMNIPIVAMAEYLQVISVNIWQIVISLLNLLLLFLILKRFLYKPVKKVLKQRREAVEEDFRAGEEAKASAIADKEAYERKLAGAKGEADAILQEARESAARRGEDIVEKARGEAEGILSRAKDEADLERRKAEEGIRQEMVGVSTALAEKILGREVREEDNRGLIDDFIRELDEK